MDTTELPVSYGDWLKQRRKALDLTQAELAQRAGCSVFALRKIEAGERRPSKQLSRLLAKALEVPPDAQEAVTKMARGELSPDRLGVYPRAQESATATSCPAAPDTLPANQPPLIGREPEMTALGGLLRDPLCRLLTLIGAGGIGKTRLAIEVSGLHRSLFADGVCFVPLAPLTSSDFLVPTIAGALGFTFQAQSEPRIQLLNYLRPKQMLLVLDNFEHLLDGVGLLMELLDRAPRLKLLVTSCERLNLQNEWVFVVQGLPVPPADQIEQAQEYTSVQLFVQSARRARVHFLLGAEDQAAAASICRMVEGMPLGIELAAAWVSALTCREIAHEIERSLDFLATSIRDVPERQRSLRAVFDHSWNLLCSEERNILSHLSIFQGGFGREAAAQVAGATLPALYALISKSLVQHSRNGRYDLHEVVRQYAFARFVQEPACEHGRDRHSRYYLTLLRDRERDLKSAAQIQVIRELKEEIDNIRAAWAWAIHRGDFALIGQSLHCFGWLCNVGMLYQQGLEQIETLVQALRTRPETVQQQAVLGTALAQQGLLTFRQGRFDQARSFCEKSLSILRPVGDPALLADVLVISGVIMHLGGEFGHSVALMEEGLVAADSAGDRPHAAYALFNLGYIAGLQGRYAEGYAQMLTGLAQWREIGDPSSIAMGLNFISPTAIHLGRLAEAQAFLEESLRLLTPVGDRWGMGTAYRLLGVVALRQGRIAEAQTLIRQSLDLFSGFITGWDLARSLIYLGEATAADGDSADARRIFLEALELAHEIRAIPLLLEIMTEMAQLYRHAADPVTAIGIVHVVLNHPAATHEVRERAACLYAQVKATLTHAQVQTAVQWAANHPLETIVEMVSLSP